MTELSKGATLDPAPLPAKNPRPLAVLDLGKLPMHRLRWHKARHHTENQVISKHWLIGSICGGRNYQGGNDAEFQQLLDGTAGEVSVTTVINCLYDEMDRRYKLLDADQDMRPFVNCILDKTLAALDEAGKILVPLMLKLLRETRKVRIR